MSGNEAKDNVFVVFFIASYLGHINGIQLAKYGSLTDRTSKIYMKVRLKALVSVFAVFDKLLLKLSLIGVFFSSVLLEKEFQPDS